LLKNNDFFVEFPRVFRVFSGVTKPATANAALLDDILTARP
jgi:hypothetical protein